jgi:hypothetical protein
MRPAPTSRPLFSAAGDALAFAVEFHGALADREVGGRLDLLYERRRLGICPHTATDARWGMPDRYYRLALDCPGQVVSIGSAGLDVILTLAQWW